MMLFSANRRATHQLTMTRQFRHPSPQQPNRLALLLLLIGKEPLINQPLLPLPAISPRKRRQPYHHQAMTSPMTVLPILTLEHVVYSLVRCYPRITSVPRTNPPNLVIPL